MGKEDTYPYFPLFRQYEEKFLWLMERKSDKPFEYSEAKGRKVLLETYMKFSCRKGLSDGSKIFFLMRTGSNLFTHSQVRCILVTQVKYLLRSHTFCKISYVYRTRDYNQ